MFEKFDIENTELFIKHEESIFGDMQYVLYATDGSNVEVVKAFDTEEEAKFLMETIKIRFKLFIEYKKQHPKTDFSKRLPRLFRTC